MLSARCYRRRKHLTPAMLKDLRAVRGKFYIHKLIDEGEHEHQDFKFGISDARKIARSISAFANNDGGRLLVGVRDNGSIAGIRSEEDLHLIEAAAQVYCRPAVEVEMQAFLCEGGAVVVRCEIPAVEHRPVEVREEDGKWKAYYRVADENIVAHPLMVRAWRIAQDGGESGSLAFSSAEGELLAALNRRGRASAEELMVDAHLSRSAASDIIARLAALDIIGFEYHHPRFLLIPNG